MRPAALPPGVSWNPTTSPTTAIYYTLPQANPLPGMSSGVLYGDAEPGGVAGTNPWNNPSTYGNATAPLWNTFVGDPGVRNYFLFTGYPSAAVEYGNVTFPAGWSMDPAATYPTATYYGYPTIPNPAPISAGATFPTAATITAPLTYNWPVYPPAIPARRLFQIPDAYNGATAGALPTTGTASPSNAGETGDPSINLIAPINNPLPTIGATTFIVPVPAAGALPPITYVNGVTTSYGVLNNSVVNLYWPGANAATLYASTGGTTNVPLPGGGASHYLGSSATATRTDARQHPYWRTEHLQRMINQTTVRTHQYAVWITIGFFEVIRQGDLGMLATNPQLAFDILGPEIGAANGKTTRFRNFFLIDRLQLAGFNFKSPGAFHAAVVYRQRIQ